MKKSAGKTVSRTKTENILMEAARQIALVEVISATYSQKTDPLVAQNINSKANNEKITKFPALY
jgi:hypothetical protein